MSFDPAQLSVLAYANGFTHWHYRSNDPLARLLSADYFAPAAEMLRPGDQLTLNLLEGETVGLAHCVVASLASRKVDLALVAASPTGQAARRAA